FCECDHDSLSGVWVHCTDGLTLGPSPPVLTVRARIPSRVSSPDVRTVLSVFWGLKRRAHKGAERPRRPSDFNGESDGSTHPPSGYPPERSDPPLTEHGGAPRA